MQVKKEIWCPLEVDVESLIQNHHLDHPQGVPRPHGMSARPPLNQEARVVKKEDVERKTREIPFIVNYLIAGF